MVLITGGALRLIYGCWQFNQGLNKLFLLFLFGRKTSHNFTKIAEEETEDNQLFTYCGGGSTSRNSGSR